MRFKRIRAIAFGPFKDRQLELAPGLTIVAGLNGAGKSSWHAALYAGLCGIRRGAGQRSEDRYFEERHRPWGERPWAVATELVLDKGQKIELHYDLDGKVDCSATDADLGTDLSGEIIYDGAPDGARFVGLDRKAFSRTACIRQAEILEVAGAADELQDYLQRAAASAGKDATASAAIAAIEEFESEHVGLDRRNSTKPLRVAKESVERSEAELAAARAAHAQYLARLVERERLKHEAGRLERHYAIADAVATKQSADELALETARVRELAAQFGTEPPRQLEEDHGLADAIAGALSEYDNFPPEPISGDDSSLLAAELEKLPMKVEGETEPDSLIKGTSEDLVKAEAAAAEHDRHRPTQASVASVTVAEPASARVRGAFGYLIGGLALLASGALLLFREPLWAGIVALFGVGIGVGVVLGSRRSHAEPPKQFERASETATWEGRAKQHAAEIDRLKSDLHHALEARGYDVTAGLSEARQCYINDCADRNRIAAQAARRPDLEQRFTAAQRQEQQCEDYHNRRQQLERRLHDLRLQAGNSDGANDFEALRAWQRERASRLQNLQLAIAAWEEQQNLLAGRAIETMEAEASRKAQEAHDLAKSLPREELEAFREAHGIPDSVALRLLREQASTARTEADTEAGNIASMARSLSSVAEAEESVAEAARQLERVQRLKATLDRAHDFLERAQESVHRNIAPVLVSSLEKWLPIATNGLYTRAAIDPETLKVRVRSESGPWRDAMALSHGTAEQIYLLLRIAMVDHLTKSSAETCPLLLDDITAHCDAVRTLAIMTLLHEMSKERQIIVFTQQAAGVDWARQTLDSARDRLEMLDESLINA